MKVFLSQVIRSLDVGPNATRVGVVNYASSVKLEFPLRAHHSKAALLQAVRRIQPLSTGTMTGLALQFALTEAFSDAEGGGSRSPDISKVCALACAEAFGEFHSALAVSLRRWELKAEGEVSRQKSPAAGGRADLGPALSAKPWSSKPFPFC